MPGGDYEGHRAVARKLGTEVPAPGEVISLRVVPAEPGTPWTVDLDGRSWRLAREANL
ncbi:NaeI family type II restriction endonuclease [Kribbella sp. NPDC048915]|uniref:NaeI family type II restriction endonuclease n=1 Tax=Kribbella sp. NPDC048915 TaxID=3155148 RepID=UPI0033CB23DB